MDFLTLMTDRRLRRRSALAAIVVGVLVVTGLCVAPAGASIQGLRQDSRDNSPWALMAQPPTVGAFPAADATQLARLGGHKGESSAFKPDPIYGGGRGKDPYGSPLESDPYKPGGVLKERANRPPNAFFGPRQRADRKDKDESEPPPQRRRQNPEDRAQDNRANRAAQGESSQESEGSGEQ